MTAQKALSLKYLLWIFTALLILFIAAAVALIQKSSRSPYLQLDALLKYSQKLQTSSQGGYKILPPSSSYNFNGQEFSTNSLGLRGKEALSKESGVYRFAVLGSWLAAGVGLPEYASIPSRLEYYLAEGITNKALQVPIKKFEVLNLAVGGNNLSQQTSLLKDLGAKLDLDAVILLVDPADLILSSTTSLNLTPPGFWERSLEVETAPPDIPTFSSSPEQILEDANWNRLRSELASLRGQVSPALDVDIIPALLPFYKIAEEDREELRIAVTDLFSHAGFFSCPLEEDNSVLPSKGLDKELFMGSDIFSQNISVQIVNCLSIRGLRY